MSIRDALEQAMSKQENETIEQPEAIEQPIEAAPEPIENEEVSEGRQDRDETGKFKAKESNGYETPKEEPAMQAQEQEKEPEIDDTPRPTTWKKEYLPLWDKARNGEQLSKEEGRALTNYLNQREQEYKKGVSTYKQEAERARALEEAINPFVPELQSQGIHPAAWINNLGRAHMILTKAPYQERVAMFHRLAGEYGIQFNQGGEPVQQAVDPYTQQLMAQLQQVNQEVGSIKSRFQQEEDVRLNAEIDRFSSDVDKYPHFEALREDMAQLLELGKAQDLDSAYRIATRLNEDVWQQEQERLLSQAKQEALKQAQVQKAKSAAVSVKTTTPSGVTSDGVDKKDRRAVIGSAFENISASRV